jgi:glucose-6-phosphate 1-dehydrogenase
MLDESSLPETCTIESCQPIGIVIFGASGDLTARKLIPALYDLYVAGCIDAGFYIIGVGRTELDNPDFVAKLEKELSASSQLTKWKEFAEKICYLKINYDDKESYYKLKEYLSTLDEKYDTQGNRLFYLAVPPNLYPTIARHLGNVGLSEQRDGSWTRLIVEKPFGRDLDSALELDRVLHKSFGEDQIFRIDHYLAKETVQNILLFRMANSIFEPIWNRKFIEHIEIIATETLGVEHRAGYYEQSGVIRDMFQNHMLQLLSLTAMEPPATFDAEHIRDEKVKIFRSLRRFPVDKVYENLVLGQYSAGKIEGTEVVGYRQEKGINPKSVIPTYAKMKVFIDNQRWEGVPFYLVSGKRLAQKRTEIAVQFKQVPHLLFKDVIEGEIASNRLTLEIYPDETISLTFQTKRPGIEISLQPVTMHFDYKSTGQTKILDAYSKVLLACMLGDHLLFWRKDGVAESWSFLTPIIGRCESCEKRAENLKRYTAGSYGPEADLE